MPTYGTYCRVPSLAGVLDLISSSPCDSVNLDSQNRQKFFKSMVFKILPFLSTSRELEFYFFGFDLRPVLFRHWVIFKAVVSHRRLNRLVFTTPCQNLPLNRMCLEVSVTALCIPWNAFFSLEQIKTCKVAGGTYSVELFGLWNHSPSGLFTETRVQQAVDVDICEAFCWMIWNDFYLPPLFPLQSQLFPQFSLHSHIFPPFSTTFPIFSISPTFPPFPTSSLTFLHFPYLLSYIPLFSHALQTFIPFFPYCHLSHLSPLTPQVIAR